MAERMSVNQLLAMELKIPDYQRPYKWSTKSVEELLNDINIAIEESQKYNGGFQYRIGTIILHEEKKGLIYNVVDGQQRVITLFLIKNYLVKDLKCPIAKMKFSNKITQANIHKNFMYIREWFTLKGAEDRKRFIDAFENILEVVVITVEKLPEAFQLFDSQNNRGKSLDPHDLLKAYHLREMKNNIFDMEQAVKKWESKDTAKIKELFDLYLYPIWNWSRVMKSKTFTDKEIDTYKGIPESSTYSYALRVNKAMPYFQIAEPFISGNDFFEMVDYYLNLLYTIKKQIVENEADFGEIKDILCNGAEVKTVEELDDLDVGNKGFNFSRNLFYCILLHYYDKFGNFDAMAVKKLFTWAFMIRVDMQTLGFDTINKYAIGEYKNAFYSNHIAMFSKISMARVHNEILGISIKVLRDSGHANDSKWDDLYGKLKKMNGLVEAADD